MQLIILQAAMGYGLLLMFLLCLLIASFIALITVSFFIRKKNKFRAGMVDAKPAIINLPRIKQIVLILLIIGICWLVYRILQIDYIL